MRVIGALRAFLLVVALSPRQRRPPPSGSASPWTRAGASPWATPPAPSSRRSMIASGARWTCRTTGASRGRRARTLRAAAAWATSLPASAGTASRSGCPAGARGREAWLEFDGVYMNSDVWINGVHLGNRPIRLRQLRLRCHRAPGAGGERGRRAGGQLATAQLAVVHRQRHLSPRLADHRGSAARGPLGNLRDHTRGPTPRARRSWSAPGWRTITPSRAGGCSARS